jgi:hypothetical protein
VIQRPKASTRGVIFINQTLLIGSIAGPNEAIPIKRPDQPRNIAPVLFAIHCCEAQDGKSSATCGHSLSCPEFAPPFTYGIRPNGKARDKFVAFLPRIAAVDRNRTYQNHTRNAAYQRCINNVARSDVIHRIKGRRIPSRRTNNMRKSCGMHNCRYSIAGSS